MDNVFAPVALERCDSYDVDEIYAVMKRQAVSIGLDGSRISGKNVVIKPNLVTSKAPDTAATTHPAFLEAAVRLIREYSPASVLLAESPGGPYTELALNAVYKGCEIDKTAERISLELNRDVSYSEEHCKDSKLCHAFNIIEPLRRADVIINLCKLKSHSLTKMTCATKNFFGSVPGVLKFELHARYPLVDDFSEMIVDLAECVMRDKYVVCFCDAIVAMEGNGPNFGIPRKLGCMLASTSPYVLDIVAASIIGYATEDLPIQKKAAERGLCPASSDPINVIGEKIEAFAVTDFLPPDSKNGGFLGGLSTFMGGRLAKFLEPRPLINRDKCVGCGRCERSCPKKTIVMVERGGKKTAKINKKNCIKCYCCQELCPFDAVKTHSNFLIKLVH